MTWNSGSGNGKVVLHTTSNAVAENNYNYSELILVDPELTGEGNFDLTLDYNMPNGLTAYGQYNVPVRIYIEYPKQAGKTNVDSVYLERSSGNYYAKAKIFDITSQVTQATTDTSGKLRINRTGNVVKVYYWKLTGLVWAWQELVFSPAVGSLAAGIKPTSVKIGQYAQRNTEAQDLTVQVDNIKIDATRLKYTDMSIKDITSEETATGGSVSTVVNSAKSWTTNQWTGYYVVMTYGNNIGVSRKITDNEATTLTVSPAFSTTILAGDKYKISLYPPDPSSTYYYKVRAYKDHLASPQCGEWDLLYTNMVNEITNPAMPTNFVARPAGSKKMELLWTNNDVVAQSTAGGSTTAIVTSGKTWVIDQWANYYVVMTSGDNIGLSRLITGNSATTLTVTPELPYAVGAGNDYRIVDRQGYIIEKKAANGQFVAIATLAADLVQYIDTKNLNPNKQYTYRIRAYRNADYSPYSSEASGTTYAWGRTGSDDTTCLPEEEVPVE